MDWKNKTNLPWKRCSKTEDCIRMVKDGKEGVKFTVTYEVEGGFLIHELSDCGMSMVLFIQLKHANPNLSKAHTNCSASFTL